MTDLTPSCTDSTQVLCKHVRATKRFYVDLNWIPAGVTVSNPVADSLDLSISIDSIAVVAIETIVEQPSPCASVTLYASRALTLLVSGGTSDPDNEVIVTVSWDQSNGESDARGLRLIVSGDE